jgi:hypothetical protein
LKAAVLAGHVNVVIPEYNERGYWTGGTRDSVREEWVKGFVGPVAREVGIDLFLKNVTINGEKLDNRWYRKVSGFAAKYLASEAKRLEKAAEEKARKTGQTTWSEPGQFLIPDIGTVVKLTEDWTFDLYEESRNEAFLKRMGINNVDVWRHYQGQGRKMRRFAVTIGAGAELAVDRVYIRKGADEYSSITFNLHKGSTVNLLGKTLNGFGRFWAKLSAVNQMKVQIDMGTMAEN